MTYTTSGMRLGPESTPDTIKKLILVTCAVTIGVAFFNSIVVYFWGEPGPIGWLSLSWWGMRSYKLWQPLTFLFVQQTGYGGINLSFLLILLFNMYILWVFGSDVLSRVGKASFLKFYFGCGVCAGLCALLFMLLTGQYSVLSGATPSILALLVAWTLIYPDSIIFLFFLIPLKAKWLTLGVLGAILLVNLSNFDVVNLTFFGSAMVAGYLYSLIIWGLHSPFPQLYKMELAIVRAAMRIKKTFVSFPGSKKAKEDKTQPISKPKELDDEAFIDEMLEKISRQGQHSLSRQEQQRMDRIAEKRRARRE